MTGDSRLQQSESERRSGGLAKPHPEVEERTMADLLDKASVPRLDRAMRDNAMVEGVRVGGEQHRGSGR